MDECANERKETQVSKEILLLEEAAKAYQELSLHFGDDLRIVLRDEEPQSTPDKKEIKKALVPLASGIRTIREDVEKGNHRLHNYLKRLEL